jgi:long-chain acyl-CoA synthetase
VPRSDPPGPTQQSTGSFDLQCRWVGRSSAARAREGGTALEEQPAESGPQLHTVAAMLRHWAAVTPDAPMLTTGDVTLTWDEVYRRARQVSRALDAEGVGPGDRVAFLDRNGSEYFEVFFGCALLSAVSVAVNWRLAPGEMAAIVEDARTRVLFYGADYADAVKEMLALVTSVHTWVPLEEFAVWREAGPADPAADPGVEPRPQDVVTQLYTSGTTGLPKGVMLSASNFSTMLEVAGDVFEIAPDTVSLVAMPLFHIGGTGWAISAMSQGGHSVIVRDLDPVTVLRVIEQHRVTEAFLVPAVLMMLLATPELADTDVSSLRTIFYGASPISEAALVRSMAALGCDFTQVYGLTETTGAITGLVPDDHDPAGPRSHLLRSAGKPFAHVELRIVDATNGEEVATGEVGEIWTRSAQNMLGYWEKPAETRSVLSEEGWFRTGDAGWLDEEGYLFLYDRIKDMIVSGGENVYPAEVENALLAHPDVADAAVIGVPDDRWGETVKAIVVPAPEAPADRALLAADILAATRDRLAHYKCPTSVDFVDVLPRNPSGKVLKRELRRPYWPEGERNIH